MADALVTQIGEDLPQFKAFIDDMFNQGMKTGTSERALKPVGLGSLTMSDKASQFIDDSFTPAYLRTRAKDGEIEMA
jgi:hypothetical protein